MTAADSPLPIVVRNELTVPATVLLAVTPRKACLEVGEIEPVVVEAQSETNVRVPLHARANCSVVVTAQLTATDGLSVSAAVRFTAQVAPTIESIGTIVVGILLAIGLVLGIVRTVRRGQSARRGARTEAEAGTSTSLPVLGGTAPDGRHRRAGDPMTDDGARRGAALMASGTAVSRMLGLLRAMVMVSAIGATGQAADAFAVANKLPNVLYMLLAGGVLNAILVPQVVRAYKRKAGQEYVDRLLTFGFAVLAGATVVLTLLAPVPRRPVLELRQPGAGRARDDVRLLVHPAAVLLRRVRRCSGQVLNARGSFGPYMWAPAVNNVVAIVGFGVFIAVFGVWKTSGVVGRLRRGPAGRSPCWPAPRRSASSHRPSCSSRPCAARASTTARAGGCAGRASGRPGAWPRGRSPGSRSASSATSSSPASRPPHRMPPSPTGWQPPPWRVPGRTTSRSSSSCCRTRW